MIFEFTFLSFFTHWYIGRYVPGWSKLPFWQMLAWIVGLSALALTSGWWWPLLRRKKTE